MSKSRPVGVADISLAFQARDGQFKSDTGCKICAKCNKSKSLEEFSKRGDGHQSWCKLCNKEHKREWLKSNRDRVRWNTLWTKYRIRKIDYEKLLSEQDNKCKICLEELLDVPHIDHDHSCCDKIPTCGNCVRGLLCSKCNRMLGALERPGVLDSAIKYLSQ